MIRYKITGTTYFQTFNRAFYPYSFVEVPDYAMWIPVEMPSDFKRADCIVEENGNYVNPGNYKWEGHDKFFYRREFKGNFRITYKPVPATLTSETDILEIDDLTSRALGFYIASWLSPYENQSVTNPLFQKYEELKYSLSKKGPYGENKIQDVTGLNQWCCGIRGGYYG